MPATDHLGICSRPDTSHGRTFQVAVVAGVTGKGVSEEAQFKDLTIDDAQVAAEEMQEE